jgi:hypothetical protein
MRGDSGFSARRPARRVAPDHFDDRVGDDARLLLMHIVPAVGVADPHGIQQERDNPSTEMTVNGIGCIGGAFRT